MRELIKISRNKEGKLVVSSRQVAKDFGKEHKNVVRAIENLTAQNSAVKNMMIKSTFEHRGNEYTEYLLTRDGFSLLVMGFTGKEALDWKLKYIEAFNAMEQALKNNLPSTVLTQNMVKNIEEKTEEDRKLLQRLTELVKVNHKQKLNFNRMIKSLVNNKEEELVVRDWVLASLNCLQWQDVPVEKYSEVVRLIKEIAPLVTTKTFEQLKLF